MQLRNQLKLEQKTKESALLRYTRIQKKLEDEVKELKKQVQEEASKREAIEEMFNTVVLKRIMNSLELDSKTVKEKRVRVEALKELANKIESIIKIETRKVIKELQGPRRTEATEPQEGGTVGEDEEPNGRRQEEERQVS